MNFSANLGFLFTELTLPEAIRAAKTAGFAAVECHFPYDVPPADVKAALDETGLPMLGLNTRPGDTASGDFGLAALPSRRDEARQAIEQAVAYGAAIGARNVHVMAGKIGVAGEATFHENLAFACDLAAGHDIGILIEPINQRDAPGYHLSRVEQAADVIAAVGKPNLRMMFDCYHTQIMQGDLTRRIERHLPLVGHIQIAAVPDRGEPNEGEVNFPALLNSIRALGYTAPIGAEYRPRSGNTHDGLGWLTAYRP
ncbi:hydroxypyruvate isomerase family protein [Oceaniglobus trochenteri]|uniref:hydroxypyruvate isomerase family protein n=1 Tax=Oceaniglobus trochenteri TaxID=2763260 RepID=UPI001CFFF76F|nr:TIM barrel protein [Oceaniglobus trochenteri]